MKKLALLGVLMAMLFVFAPDLSAQEIGFAWVGKSGMADRVAQGFEEAWPQLAPGLKVEYQKELGSLEELAAKVGQWQASKKGVVILRSNGAQWLGKNPPTIPAFIGACSHPSELGAIKNIMAPEGNITGVTYFLPYETHFEIFKAILPDLKSVLLLVKGSHPGAAVDIEGTKAMCQKLGIGYNEAKVETIEEALVAVKAKGGEVGAIIVGTQAEIADNTNKVVEAAAMTPVFAFSSNPVKLGALGGFAANDVKLGGMLAESVVQVLVGGKAISAVPVKMDPEPIFFVNTKTAERLKVSIPYEILQTATVVE
ncbi:MAG: ABC transporter substrate binding protein [Pseudomonadota bacterium]